MSEQITPSVTTPTIGNIYTDIKDGNLILQPDFQRKFVWTHEHQEDFIDTILNGFPFPEIYICEGETDTNTLKTNYQVIDGQQRLTTIKNYIEGNHTKVLTKIPIYIELTDTQKKQFISYKVVFRNLGQIDDTIIREIFRRINLTKFKLENIEIHNAIYDGYFIQTAKAILSKISLSDFGVFYESDFTRMADLYFIILLMATFENEGYFSADSEIESYIKKYNDEYTNADHIKVTLIKVFQYIKDLKLSSDSIWFRKSNFFTIVIELAKNINNIVGSGAEIKNKMHELEEQIMKNKNNLDSEYGIYYKHMYSGTNSRNSRIKRGEIFTKHIF